MATATKTKTKSKRPTKHAPPKRPKKAKKAAPKAPPPKPSARPTRRIQLTKSTHPTTIPSAYPRVGSTVADYVFFIFQGVYGAAGAQFARIEDVLAIDPNEWDVDPSPFYETLEAVFGVADPTKTYFDGYGGRIKDTIEFVTRRWKGGALPPMTKAGIPWGG